MRARPDADDPYPFLHSGPTPRLLAALGGRGEEIRLVGGVVRNALLGLPISDIDCATTATPDEIIRRAKAAGLRAIPTGIEHGTVTVLVDGAPFEVTTLREDVATDGRRADVRFGRDFQRDAERRDFTINALYLDGDGRIYDPVGGLADIAARRVRFIGDPATRIREDYLRILRFFRFSAGYEQGEPDAEGFNACVAARHGLRRLSPERVRAELLKILSSRRAATVLAVMADAGFLELVLGGVTSVARFAAMVASGARADAASRLAALAVETAEDAERLRERLRLSNDEQRIAATAAGVAGALRGRRYAIEPADVRSFLYRHGDTGRALAGAMLKAAAATEALGALEAERDWTIPTPPFSGRDLVAAGLAPGPALGRALALAERKWIEAGFPADAERVAGLLSDAVRDSRDRIA